MKSPTTGRAFTAAEERIVEAGIPPFLILSAEERKAAWDRNPAKAVPAFFDPRIEADKELRATHKREATAKRIFERRKAKGLIPDDGSATSNGNTGGNEMPKYVIKTLDAHGAVVVRGMSSIKDDADQDAIDAKVLAQVERGGSKVATVLLINTLGEVTLAWAVDDKGEVGPCDVRPFKTAPQETQLSEPVSAGPDTANAHADAAPGEAPSFDTGAVIQEESDMAKKTKAKVKAKVKSKKVAKVKTSKTKKELGAGGQRTGSKKEIIYNLLTRSIGCTMVEALKATGWKMCGLTVWGKRFGLKVTKEKQKDGTTRYYGT